FGNLARQQLAGECDLGWRGARWRYESGARIDTVRRHRRESRRIEPNGQELTHKPVALCGACRWIELDQDLPGLDTRAILDADSAHDSHLERLDHLNASGWNDLARHGGDDFDATKDGPSQGKDKKGDDGSTDHPSGGRRRRFDDLESGGE